MQTTTAGRVMLIHHLVLKGDLKELKKEIAKDIGQFMVNIHVFSNCTLLLLFVLTDLSSKWHYPAFEKLGPSYTVYVFTETL